MENASTEDASTSLQGWKTQVWKTQVRIHTSAHHAVQVLNTAYTGTKHRAAVVTAPASASCDVCLNAPHVTVALLPCGHATFCQQCIDTLIASSDFFPDFIACSFFG